IARDLATVSGIIRKRNNALTMTRKGEKLHADRQLLLETLIRDFVHLLDLSRYDGYELAPGLGFRDAGLSLLVFDRVRRQMPGESPSEMDYAKGYFDIRPYIYEGMRSIDCYLFRTYQNFMELFGLVTTDEKWNRDENRMVVTIQPTPLFDRMISIADNYERIGVRMSPELKICRLKITLRDTNPPVWRRIQVPSSMLLGDLHYLIQYTMGWENAHLHEFEKEEVCYTDEVNEELPSVQYGGMMIADLLKETGDKMIYRYDFGDNWEHDIELEGVTVPQEGSEYRVCTEGARRCPPEDCGGVHGYQRMLQILDDPDDPEREEYLYWLGGPYDPEAWEFSTVNLSLHVGGLKFSS
ncbi:MAG: plasmid pRiA4b ORF-3 family protein, partial [Proteiniphilum sp.]|nr:plasmid pRiA4b ORF-3 family protein [Proteiniphilum sp.]MDD3910081.1 plasmid pRiA4b ORF-3 family protein [Proteiniphilum sp.]